VNVAPTPFDRTRATQHEASDPRSSAWVIANAGSGKTHVLTQRVIRLLLAGADPASILSLTFTKVAAAEMARRIFDTLGQWVMLPEPELRAAIEDLQGRPPSADEMRAARRLFATALETPGGLKIQTIHAFCERLLHQFPFEANAPGQFTVLDDAAAAALIATARAEVMARAAAERDALRLAMRYLAERATDSQIDQALQAVIGKREQLHRWIQLSGEAGGQGTLGDALSDLRRRLGLTDEDTDDALCRQICEAVGWSRDECGALVEALRGSTHKTDVSARTALAAILGADAGSGLEADRRLDFFLNEDREKCRSASYRFGAEFARSRKGLKESFAAEADRLLALLERFNLVRAYAATEALLIVGDAILASYQAAKRRAGALDFPDLIAKTRSLFSRPDAAAWVLYKLDRRIDHILVDEAQDTSPDQWKVIQAIAEEFFSGEGASLVTRTIFAVGDDKQSIFSFQGAAPRMLAEMRAFFEKKAEAAQASFRPRQLFLSFRSTREVLDTVDEVFKSPLADRITASTYEAHASYRADQPGHVVLLPRVVRKKHEEPEDWTTPYDAPSAAETELARKIADEIERLRGTTLPSGKLLKDGEILILVRRRDALFNALNRALRARQIPMMGADRVPISTHIAVLDLLALADVVLLSDDDLQLAALLKSPLLGVDEDALMRLAAERKGNLWRALRDATEAPLQHAHEKLRRWRAMADKVTPFRFFATVLGPDGGRRAFRARLGGEADDVLDALLSQALAYEAVEAPSLQGFLRFIRANEGDLKRETEERAAGVRVMTVHGAKGLEADVVFLLDTGGLIVVPSQRDTLVDIGNGPDDPAFLWRRPKKEAPARQREADALEDEEEESEYLRLLYVAMTRARDVLYIAGIKGERTPPNCWYSTVRNALVPDTVKAAENGELSAPFTWPPEQRLPLAPESESATAEEVRVDLPAWLKAPAPFPAPAPTPLRPSRALADPDPRTFAAADLQLGAESPRDQALLRGRMVHRLLQLVATLPEAERDSAAERLLARELLPDPPLAEAIRNELRSVLSLSPLRSLLGSETRLEAPIVGRLATERGTYAVSGRIDLMARRDDGWHLVDFKSGRTVPASAAEADSTAVLQLALYRRLLMEMQPGTEVQAALVWTAEPKFMPVSHELMEAALAKLGIGRMPVP
jgi:ATP-dependent helicase/nuclease subunit A